MEGRETMGQKADMFEEFMDVTFRLSEEELQAIHGLIPMTQELFGCCMRKCEEIGAPGQMSELIADFPEQYRAYCEAGKEMADEKDAETAGSVEEDAVWQGICAQLGKM